MIVGAIKLLSARASPPGPVVFKYRKTEENSTLNTAGTVLDLWTAVPPPPTAPPTRVYTYPLIVTVVFPPVTPLFPLVEFVV
jgi:hypothetical protein